MTPTGLPATRKLTRLVLCEVLGEEELIARHEIVASAHTIWSSITDTPRALPRASWRCNARLARQQDRRLRCLAWGACQGRDFGAHLRRHAHQGVCSAASRRHLLAGIQSTSPWPSKRSIHRVICFAVRFPRDPVGGPVSYALPHLTVHVQASWCPARAHECQRSYEQKPHFIRSSPAVSPRCAKPEGQLGPFT